MMMYKKIIASGLLWAALTASAGAFDYNQSVDEIAANPLTAYQTVYLGMPRADFDGNFSVLSDWTFYGSTVSFTEKSGTDVCRKERVRHRRHRNLFGRYVGKRPGPRL